MKKSVVEQFVNPGSEYRGAPFWAWNGKLDPDELRRQIRLMHRMGLGGFFMHSRVGLNTPYLSDEWFKCVDACIDEAEKLDMKAWLYDEDRWPSGAAGGLVTKNHKFRTRKLAKTELSKPSELKWTADTVAAFTVVIEGDELCSMKRIAKGKRPAKLAKGESILSFRIVVAGDTDWHNGQAYLDCMNRDAVKKFIDVTHKEYLKRVGNHFGKRVPGIFTDEPNVPGIVGTDGTAWTGRLPAAFKKRYGYDLIARLPEIFYGRKGEEVSRTKYHYIDCVTHLFTDAFARQIGEWCEEHNLPHTGHLLCEETPSSQSRVVGSAMRSYEYMQVPGMDLLTEHRREYDTPKQVASVARQFGRKWRLDEIYGCTGWDFPFLGHKALGDWQAALGINIRCQHLAWYTMEGQAKRDYPAGIFYQNTWHESYAKVEDYFARVNLVLSTGVDIRDALVIHPVESVWTLCGTKWQSPDAAEIDTSLVALRDSLLIENIDFDYGDESIIAEHGSAGSKKGVPYLRVGKAQYEAVVVPPLRTIRRSTLDLLRKFHRAGGRVVFAGPLPQYVDALPCSDASEFAKSCVRTPAKGPSIAEAIEDVARRVSITDASGSEIPSTLYQLREDKDALYLFVCNTGHKRSELKPAIYDSVLARDRKASFPEVYVTIATAGFRGSPVELDTDTGVVYGTEARQAGTGWSIKTSLPALGSRIFMVPKRKTTRKLVARTKLKSVKSRTLSAKAWKYSLSEDNVLVLDRPRIKIGNERWFQSDDVVNADLLVRDAMGIKRRGGQMVQPWARKYQEKLRRIAVSLEYSFDVKAIPSGALFIALEQPGTFEIRVNGALLNADLDAGWWCDRSLRKLALDAGVLRLGSNTITMSCNYDEKHPGLEIVYLLGSFGASVSGTQVAITECPKTIRVGDWVKQGLPFYSGSVAYRQSINPKLTGSQRLIVEVPDYRGAGVRILVNGNEAGIIAWDPKEIDITDWLTGGTDELAIEVLGHRRNSHGPLHNSEKWPLWTGPGEFLKGNGNNWVDGYQLVPCGLLSAPRLVTKKVAR